MRFQPATSLALEMARLGVCGDPLRKEWALNVQRMADDEENYDVAAAEPLKDLAWVLRNTEDTNENSELCAQALGAVWRAQHPFRQPREGDPYSVLTPQVQSEVQKEMALAALDRTIPLPTPPPVALLQHAANLEELLTNPAIYFTSDNCIDSSGELTCNTATARALVAAAREAMARIVQRRPPEVRGKQGRVLSATMWPVYVGSLQDAASMMTAWVQNDSLPDDNVIDGILNDAGRAFDVTVDARDAVRAASFPKGQEKRYRDASADLEDTVVVYNALTYVIALITSVRQLDVQRKRRARREEKSDRSHAEQSPVATRRDLTEYPHEEMSTYATKRFAMQVTSRDWSTPVATGVVAGVAGGLLVAGLALAFAFIEPDR